MVVVFEASDMILSMEQVEHQFPPHRGQRPACFEIQEQFHVQYDVGLADAKNVGNRSVGGLRNH